MKVCIVLFSNMRYAPYYQFYAKFLDSKGIKYDTIIFDRSPELEEGGDNIIKIAYKANTGKLSKIFAFNHFRKECKKILKKNQYDKVIVLTTVPAVLLSGFLSRKYKGRYVVDIRDYTFDNIKLYRWFEKRVLSNSYANVISAPDFKKFLPSGIDYMLCHNIDAGVTPEIINENDDNVIEKRGTIKISYIGSIAYYKYCKELIDLVAKDDRFSFVFYGNDNTGGAITNYVEALGCDRIKCMGKFKPEDKKEIYLSSDLVFNCYGNSTTIVKYALSNKLYDGLLYKRPVLVSPNTSMETALGDFCFPLSLGEVEGLDDVYSWYNNFDAEQFKTYANTFLNAALADNRNVISKLSEFVE